MRTLATFAVLALALTSSGNTAEPKWLSELSQPGEVGRLGVHAEVWRGKTHWGGATVLEVMDGKRAIMRHTYGVTSDSLRQFTFLMRGIETSDWKRGQVVVLPKSLKVVEWHDYLSSDGATNSIQVFEPADEPGADKTDAEILAKRAAEAKKKAREALFHTFSIKSADGATTKVRAIYRSFTDGKYHLELESGKTSTHAAKELSLTDLAYIREQVKKSK